MRSKNITPKQIATGYLTYVAIISLIKYFIYPFLIIKANEEIFKSFLFMTIASICIRTLIILIYDKIKIDWLSIERFKTNKENKGKENNLIKRMRRLKEISGWVLMSVLFVAEPVVLVLYIRPGFNKWNGFKGKNVKLLFIVSNIVCTLIMGSVVMGFIKIF